jgi:hypothetical protein
MRRGQWPAARSTLAAVFGFVAVHLNKELVSIGEAVDLVRQMADSVRPIDVPGVARRSDRNPIAPPIRPVPATWTMTAVLTWTYGGSSGTAV